MKLTDFIIQDASVAALHAQERDQAVAELARSLVEAGALGPDQEQGVIESLVAREQSGSTGFGKGVAVPHVKHPAVQTMVAAVGISQSGIDFSALDEASVHTIILLLSPADRPNEHLQAMETLFSNLANEAFRRSLRQAGSREELAEIIEQADAHRQLV